MELQFKLSIKEFKDIFYYDQNHNNGIVKYKKKIYYFLFIFLFIEMVVICVDSLKEYSNSIIISAIIIFFTLLALIFLFIVCIFLFNFIRKIKLNKYWEKTQKHINFTSTNISVCVNNDYIIFYENEDKQYKVSLKNVEIPHIDKTKIYLKIEGRTLYYIPLNAFSSEAQKNEFIDLINKR